MEVSTVDKVKGQGQAIEVPQLRSGKNVLVKGKETVYPAVEPWYPRTSLRKGWVLTGVKFRRNVRRR